MSLGQTRREWLHLFTWGTAISLTGQPWSAGLTMHASPAADPDEGRVRIRVIDFPALNEVMGSIRLSFNPLTPGQFPDGHFYPFVITRRSATQVVVLDTRCTHANCAVSAFDSRLGVMSCPCHGSRFDMLGRVVRSPAVSPLAVYSSTFDGSTIEFQVPGLGYAIDVNELFQDDAESMRLRISFKTQPKVQYVLRFKETLDQPWRSVFYAVSEFSMVDREIITGSGDMVTVYVERTAGQGYFNVATRLRIL